MGKRKLNYPNAKNLVVWGEILLFRLPSRDEGYVWLLLKFCVRNFVNKKGIIRPAARLPQHVRPLWGRLRHL